MANLPNLSSGSVAKYGSSFSRGYRTEVLQSVNDTEQRFACQPMLAGFQLVYTDVNPYDFNIFLEFFIAHKGGFVDDSLSNCFSIVDTRIAGQPYNYCYFDQDSIETVESKPNRYSFQLKIRQARKS